MTEPADQRKKDLAEVLVGYQKLEKQLKSAPNALRYVQYRMAMLAVDAAKGDPSKVKAAIDALNNFRSTNSAGWEIVPATKTVARLLEDSGDKKGALDAYDDLGRNPDVPADIRLNTNLLVAHMLIQDGKFDGAEKKLSSVLAETKDPKQKAYVQVNLIQTQVAQGKATSPADLQNLIKGAGDDDKLKALAYNTLGDYYQQAKQPDEAFWQYLRVDVLFNQDREEHCAIALQPVEAVRLGAARPAAVEGVSGPAEGQGRWTGPSSRPGRSRKATPGSSRREAGDAHRSGRGGGYGFARCVLCGCCSC